MKITWDERKRLSNLEKHGLDFEEVISFGWQKAVFMDALPSRHGSARFKAVGYLPEVLVTIVYARLGDEAIAIISLRRASMAERKEWEWRKSRH